LYFVWLVTDGRCTAICHPGQGVARSGRVLVHHATYSAAAAAAGQRSVQGCGLGLITQARSRCGREGGREADSDWL